MTATNQKACRQLPPSQITHIQLLTDTHTFLPSSILVLSFFPTSQPGFWKMYPDFTPFPANFSFHMNVASVPKQSTQTALAKLSMTSSGSESLKLMGIFT